MRYNAISVGVFIEHAFRRPSIVPWRPIGVGPSSLSAELPVKTDRSLLLCCSSVATKSEKTLFAVEFVGVNLPDVVDVSARKLWRR